MKRFLGLLATSIGMVFLLVQAVYVQTSESDLPRLEDGRPNLNGIWQALNSANYDIERHLARPAMELREGPHGPLPSVALLALGAVAAVPAGMGVVDGGNIPYTPEALSLKQENRADWLERDPEIKMLSAWRASRDLHAVSVPNYLNARPHGHQLRVCSCGSHHLYRWQSTSAS